MEVSGPGIRIDIDELVAWVNQPVAGHGNGSYRRVYVDYACLGSDIISLLNKLKEVSAYKAAVTTFERLTCRIFSPVHMLSLLTAFALQTSKARFPTDGTLRGLASVCRLVWTTLQS